MEDYSKYLKAELITFLEQRDTRITELETEVQNLTTSNTNHQSTINKQRTIIESLESTNNLQNQKILRNEATINHMQEQINNLKNQLDDYERGTATTASQIINLIHALPKEELDSLTELIRTDTKGIEAFIIFNYGKKASTHENIDVNDDKQKAKR